MTLFGRARVQVGEVLTEFIARQTGAGSVNLAEVQGARDEYNNELIEAATATARPTERARRPRNEQRPSATSVPSETAVVWATDTPPCQLLLPPVVHSPPPAQRHH